jgi:hypothetical protein
MRLVFVQRSILYKMLLVKYCRKIRNCWHGCQQPSNLTGGQICWGRIFLQYKQVSTKQVEYLALNTSTFSHTYTWGVAKEEDTSFITCNSKYETSSSPLFYINLSTAITRSIRPGSNANFSPKFPTIFVLASILPTPIIKK